MSNFSTPPDVLLASPTVRRAIGDFIRKISGAYRFAAANTFGFGEEVQPALISWFRSRDQNAAVDGEEFSQHRFALAIDLSGEFTDLQRVQTQAERVGLSGFVNDDENVLHVQAFPAGTIPVEAFAILEKVLGEA